MRTGLLLSPTEEAIKTTPLPMPLEFEILPNYVEPLPSIQQTSLEEKIAQEKRGRFIFKTINPMLYVAGSVGAYIFGDQLHNYAYTQPERNLNQLTASVILLGMLAPAVFISRSLHASKTTIEDYDKQLKTPNVATTSNK